MTRTTNDDKRRMRSLLNLVLNVYNYSDEYSNHYPEKKWVKILLDEYDTELLQKLIRML